MLVADDLVDDREQVLDDLVQLVQRGLVDVWQLDDGTAPRFSPTARGLAAIDRVEDQDGS